MSKNSSKFPAEVRSCLWSYDTEKLDLKKDRREIITQVFNYGNWTAVKWTRSTYTDHEIREVLEKPGRGRWFKQCLHFWLLQFNINLPNDLYHRAIFELNPALRDY